MRVCVRDGSCVLCGVSGSCCFAAVYLKWNSLPKLIKTLFCFNNVLKQVAVILLVSKAAWVIASKHLAPPKMPKSRCLNREAS